MKKIIIIVFLILQNNFLFSEINTIEWGQSPEQVRLSETGIFKNDNIYKNDYYLHFTEKIQDFNKFTSYKFKNNKLIERSVFIDLTTESDPIYKKNWYLNFYDSVLKDLNEKYGDGKVKSFKGVLDKSHKWIIEDTIIISDLYVTDDSWRLDITYSKKKIKLI